MSIVIRKGFQKAKFRELSVLKENKTLCRSIRWERRHRAEESETADTQSVMNKCWLNE